MTIMKLIHSALVISILSISSNSFGQTKYIQTNEGTVVDTVTYAKIKKDKIDEVERHSPKGWKVTIKDNFKEVKRTKDSLIYSYKWETEIGYTITTEKTQKSFEPGNYIDKIFQMPTLKTLDNKTITLDKLKGKPTLINFWFTTCMPCIEEMPVLNRIRQQLKDSVNFIAITYESTEKTRMFLKEHRFDFIQVPDAKIFTNSMNMSTFPVNIFLDKNGVVKKIEKGIPFIMNENEKPEMGDGKDFEIFLRKLL
jgi:cytochrome c biogenesis protein CcmG, thiol:disulfide interchange protein DsbE